MTVGLTVVQRTVPVDLCACWSDSDVVYGSCIVELCDCWSDSDSGAVYGSCRPL